MLVVCSYYFKKFFIEGGGGVVMGVGGGGIVVGGVGVGVCELDFVGLEVLGVLFEFVYIVILIISSVNMSVVF